MNMLGVIRADVNQGEFSLQPGDAETVAPATADVVADEFRRGGQDHEQELWRSHERYILQIFASRNAPPGKS